MKGGRPKYPSLLPRSNTLNSYWHRISAEIACFGQPTRFEIGIEEPILSILWDFGDGTTSTDEIPAHIYSATGNYTITATVTTASGTSVNTKNIIVNDMPIAHEPNDVTYCFTDGLSETSFLLSQKDSEILVFNCIAFCYKRIENPCKNCSIRPIQ